MAEDEQQGRWRQRHATRGEVDVLGQVTLQSTTLNKTQQRYHNAMGRNMTTTRGYATTLRQQRYEMEDKTERVVKARCNATAQQSNKAGMTRCVRGQDTTTRQDKTQQRDNLRTMRQEGRQETQCSTTTWCGNAMGSEQQQGAEK